MFILGIETSCDETAAAVVKNGTSVLSNVIATSKYSFEHSGGVIPESAARRQVECILPVIEQALNDAHTLPKHIDAIAVTKGPGLLGSLLVGTTTARVLASVWKKPLIGVRHTLGHLSSTFLNNTTHYSLQSTHSSFPLLALSVSGGHTELWYRKSHTKGILLGQTRDDAAGEAFDKGARLLGLHYPGGPSIEKAAKGGDKTAYNFPLPLKGEPTLDFSFSGLKTALKYLLIPSPLGGGLGRWGKIVLRNKEFSTTSPWPSTSGRGNNTLPISDFAAAYQHAICRHLIDRLQHAYQQYPDAREIHIVGGVSANSHLRTLFTQTIPNIPACFPFSLSYCTDNAAMIAAAGYFMAHEMKKRAFVTFETGSGIIA